MKAKFTFFFVLISGLQSIAQITILGYSMLNNSALPQTTITVQCNGATTKTLNTGGRSDFKVELPFGQIYKVYFQNRVGPVMHLEVVANTVPIEKYRYLMTYELLVPFVNRHDDDVDTLVFSQPFHRISFNGLNRMVADTAYNLHFENSIIKKTVLNDKVSIKNDPTSKVVLTGKVSCGSRQACLVEKPIRLIGKNGQILKSTITNRLGAFAFTGITASDADYISMDFPEISAPTEVLIVDGRDKVICQSIVGEKKCRWQLTSSSMDKLLDNNFGTNIGGKLIYSNPREKKFFANKTVYLCNRLNTVVKKTQTNLFGTFVFEDIKPDNMYFIGVDRSEISSGSKIDLLNKEDRYVTSLDSLIAGRMSFRLLTAPNKSFNDISIAENEMKMDVKATIFGDNVNNPIGKLKILLLNDRYEVIDSAITDNFGTFKFKYLPFLKRFYLSADNTDNVLDVFKNILIYSSDANLIKIMTHQKGNKFNYNPVSAELNRLRDIEMEDPWLQLVGPDLGSPSEKESVKSDLLINDKNGPKLIVENILFEANNSKITPQAREVLDKVVLVLARNQALCIEVGAHTDSKGLAATNLKLSDERAKVVRQYIVNAGIKSERISARGYGESKLLNQCDDQHDCTEKEHAQNRRIEFKILDNPEAHQK